MRSVVNMVHAGIFSFLIVVATTVFAQDQQYQILFADISPEAGQTSLTSIPQTISYSVNWSLYEKDAQGNYIKVAADKMEIYEVSCYEIIVDRHGTERHEYITTERVNVNYHTFRDRKFDATTGFRVRGFLTATADDPVVESTEARISNSVEFRFDRYLGKATGLFKFKEASGYNFFAEAGKAFSKAGFFGKLAFVVLLILFLLWIPAIVIFSIPNSSKKRLTGEAVESLISNWQEVIKDADIVKSDEEYEQIPDDEKKLYIKESDLGKDRTLDEESQILLWRQKITPALKNLLQKSDENARKFPLGRIVLAGVKNYAINKYNWYASQEIDRAMDAVASAELEKLKTKTLTTWLWNLGAIAPLLGLLGTVTGIGRAFWRLGVEVLQKKEAFTNVDMIEKLGPGISEALWTTIIGLIVGVILMGSHYVIKHRVDGRYSEWEDKIVSIAKEI